MNNLSHIPQVNSEQKIYNILNKKKTVRFLINMKIYRFRSSSWLFLQGVGAPKELRLILEMTGAPFAKTNFEIFMPTVVANSAKWPLRQPITI